jgi:hypothetical protein
MPRLKPARHRIQNTWVATLILALSLVSCWKVNADLVISTKQIDFASTKITNSVTVRNDSEDNALTSGVVTLDYQFKSNQTWLTVTPATGDCGAMETHSHTVTVDRSRMKYGENIGSIAVTSNGGNATIAVRAFRDVPGCDTPPTAAVAVYPLSGASNVASNSELSWAEGESQCSQLTATYDVYFGTTSPPPFDHNNDSLKVWSPGPLAHNTTYFWRVVVKDANGEIKGPQWTFQTTCDLGPTNVTLLSPADGATNLGVNEGLSWGNGTSQCLGLSSSYDVYFGTVSPPPFVHNTTTKFFDPGTLAKGETYYWKIVAKDAHGTTSSPVRSFTTGSCQLLPLAVQLLGPADGATNVAINQSVTWAGGASQCGLAGSFDVYFGTVSPPPFAANTTLKYWAPGTLAYNTTFYWKVVAKDGNGSTSSTERSFTTVPFVCSLIPGAVTLTAPASGATAVPLDQSLTWTGGNSQCADETATYDVYFGTTATPPLDHNNGTSKTWSPSLDYDTQYYWRIVAKDNNGAKSSETRSFRTPCHLPPSAVNLLLPVDGKSNVPADAAALSWGGGNNQCPGMAAPTYDVYFGTTASPPFQTNTSIKYWAPETPLQEGVKYYWKIIAKNANGTTSSSVRSFTTASTNCTLPPAAVTLLGPDDGVTFPGGNLSWEGGASQCATQTSSYDVYFGTTSPPPLHHNNEASTTWTPPLADNTQYYWRIVARDNNGSTSSEQRSFKTACTATPSAPALASPANTATNIGIDSDISWTAGNSRCSGLTATYDVYFGQSSTPPLAESNVTVKTWDPGTLTKGVTYYWKIVAKDANGSTSSAVWRFQTELPPCLDPPLVACNPNPSNNATNRNRDSNLSWGCGTSACGKTVTYDVYLGTSATLGDAQKVGTTTNKQLDLPRLNGLTKYYWKVIARDANGATPSPVWSFTTKS